ncbi:TPA: tRNA (guanine(10)-N(2))-dimethyltransferase [Candidatus Woesearchaeota archaeon]|nr:tRNA (guanine(10)-N(2))-dimethyltransferase [Candidatus Woesearchaeota archaeon]
MFQEITEGPARLKVPVGEKISADLPVFYNPVMKFNRDISVLLLKALDREGMQICDPLAGSGVRSIRFLLELPENMVRHITINDKDEESFGKIKENLGLNKISADGERVVLENRDANALLLSSTGYDYIDVDPFGTPNPFLDAACRRLARNGILAVTATDTSALSGTFINACKRKYWAVPRRDYLMHETGLRILIRKCQLIAAQYDKALVPIFSYSKDHYMRIFFRAEKGKEKVDNVIRQHGMHEETGPLWLGALWDAELVAKMYDLSLELKYDLDHNFLGIMKDEAKIDVFGFFDIHALCKKKGVECPRFETVFEGLKKQGYIVSRTHFSPYAIRTNAPQQAVLGMLGK